MSGKWRRPSAQAVSELSSREAVKNPDELYTWDLSEIENGSWGEGGAVLYADHV